MATTYKVLGQTVTAAGIGSETELYKVPLSTSAVASSLVICNTASTATTYRVAVRAYTSGSPNTQLMHYIVYSATIAANDSTVLTLGLTLQASQVVQVSCATATVAFSLFGSEIS